MITESTAGRVIEVNRKGKTVWKFVNPQVSRGGAVVALVPEMIRIANEDPRLGGLIEAPEDAKTD